MKFLLSLSFIVINLISYSQEYGIGHELVKLQGATIEFYDGKTLDNLLPKK